MPHQWGTRTMVVARPATRASIASPKRSPARTAVAGCCLTSYVVPGLALALLLTAAVGLPTAGIGVGCTTLLRTAVADEYRGRVFGAFGVTGALAMLVGARLGECWATCLAS